MMSVDTFPCALPFRLLPIMTPSAIIPAISYIVPIFNTAPWLPACLDSLLQQSNANWEALLVDDGSTDDSIAIAEAYAGKDARFRVFRHPHAGPSAVRNFAIPLCRGRWVGFLDSDDWVAPSWTASFLAAALAWPSAEIILQGFTRDMPNGQSSAFPLPTSPSSSPGEEHPRFLSGPALVDFLARIDRLSRGSAALMVVSQELLQRENLRFEKSIRASEDECFKLDCIAAARAVAITPETGYHYRIHRGSLTGIARSTSPSAKESRLPVEALWKHQRALLTTLSAGGSLLHAEFLSLYLKGIYVSLFRHGQRPGEALSILRCKRSMAKEAQTLPPIDWTTSLLMRLGSLPAPIAYAGLALIVPIYLARLSWG